MSTKRKRPLVEQHLPAGWWKNPVFDWGVHHPFPYIWFGYWLITWEEDNDWLKGAFGYRFKMGSRWYPGHYAMFRFLRISISFLPD